ncbi:methyltransferase domain-containing protein [candidate division KSB1 bacterium]|nr:methyltransferase domain-containing protein [candidate division KSB1 bacterium]MBL7092562.1 methyltransferase domain-containing protein [candidate division KSB1 bacterium]
MNTIKRKLKIFYEEVGEKYPEEEIVYKTLRGKLRKKFILTYLNNFKGSLLDIGCNQGMYLDEYEGGSRFGVDISFNVLKKTSKKKIQHLVVADAEQLQCFKKSSFDNVLCSEVLEHCLNPIEIFKGISHVLIDDGYALLTTPNYKRYRPKWIGLGRLPQYGVSFDNKDGYFHTAYRPEQLVEFAKKAGLKIVESGTLEKEVKYAAKIPAAILLFGRFVNKIFRSQKFNQMNQQVFDNLTLLIYHGCRILKIEKILLKIFTDGVRSYILVKKS